MYVTGADASAVMPFDFTRLIFTSLLGWLMFGEKPDGWTYVGAAIIVTSTVYIARREARALAGASHGHGRESRPARHPRLESTSRMS